MVELFVIVVAALCVAWYFSWNNADQARRKAERANQTPEESYRWHGPVQEKNEYGF